MLMQPQDVGHLLEQGFTKFVFDLGGVRETGSSFLGLLMTMTRRIRQRRAEAVLAHLAPDTERFINDMRMDDTGTFSRRSTRRPGFSGATRLDCFDQGVKVKWARG